MDGSAVLPRNESLKISQTSLRNETDQDAAEALQHVKEARAKAAELVEALESTWQVVVHDISGDTLNLFEIRTGKIEAKTQLQQISKPQTYFFEDIFKFFSLAVRCFGREDGNAWEQHILRLQATFEAHHLAF